jgi:hypothetical protein
MKIVLDTVFLTRYRARHISILVVTYPKKYSPTRAVKPEEAMKFAASLFVILALSAPSSSAAPVCVFGTVPCFLACGSPPRLTDANQAALWLRSTEYGSLNWLD